MKKIIAAIAITLFAAGAFAKAPAHAPKTTSAHAKHASQKSSHSTKHAKKTAHAKTKAHGTTHHAKRTTAHAHETA